MSGIIVDILSGPLGERRLDELYAQAFRDAEGGRPVASEHPLYGINYQSVAQLIEVRAGRLILVVESAALCLRCRYLDVGSEHRGCRCASFMARGPRLAGAMVVYGPMSDDLVPTFAPCEQLHALTQTGLRIQDMEGADMTHHFNAIQ